MQEKKRPVAVGFFFSLGHSTVVVLASIAIAFVTSAMKGRFDHYKEMGGILSTSASALFLFAIALMNLIILRSIYRAWRNDASLNPYFLHSSLTGMPAASFRNPMICSS
jgi:high-affinity nickel-transport protein